MEPWEKTRALEEAIDLGLIGTVNAAHSRADIELVFEAKDQLPNFKNGTLIGYHDEDGNYVPYTGHELKTYSTWNVPN